MCKLLSFKAVAAFFCVAAEKKSNNHCTLNRWTIYKIGFWICLALCSLCECVELLETNWIFQIKKTPKTSSPSLSIDLFIDFTIQFKYRFIFLVVVCISVSTRRSQVQYQIIDGVWCCSNWQICVWPNNSSTAFQICANKTFCRRRRHRRW